MSSLTRLLGLNSNHWLAVCGMKCWQNFPFHAISVYPAVRVPSGKRNVALLFLQSTENSLDFPGRYETICTSIKYNTRGQLGSNHHQFRKTRKYYPSSKQFRDPPTYTHQPSMQQKVPFSLIRCSSSKVAFCSCVE